MAYYRSRMDAGAGFCAGEDQDRRVAERAGVGIRREGGYDHPTGEFVEDGGYHLHWAEYSRTTLGCGRVGGDTDEQARLLAGMVQEALDAGDVVTLEVV
jgi:hypothetical protein